MSHFTFTRLSLVGAILATFSQVFTLQIGNALASFFVAVCLGLNELAHSPNRAYEKATNALGMFFVNASRVARRLVFAIAIGGSLLVIDQVYVINFLPIFEPLDDVIKRLSVALVCVTLVVFASSVVALNTSRVAVAAKDTVMRNFELHFYFSAFLLMISGCSLVLGSRVEDMIPGTPSSTGITLPDWPTSVSWFLFTVSLISIVWVIAASMCIFSRRVELAAGSSIKDWAEISQLDRETDPSDQN
ncbi:hypothetical protein QTO30_19925 [Yoonia sp. GPGPB17]|uniref:hypothetical protein n=1 Tax=Yoonia sp. GPGPB17 TaxID=3026147 RepID=UPI0030C2389C